MRSTVNVLALLVAALCVVAFLVGGATAVLGVVVVGVAAVTCKVAAASKPRPLRVSRSKRSAVLIGHQRDPDVVHDERPDGEGVEHLVEAEPAG